jgi:hypothetical protein
MPNVQVQEKEEKKRVNLLKDIRKSKREKVGTRE